MIKNYFLDKNYNANFSNNRFVLNEGSFCSGAIKIDNVLPINNLKVDNLFEENISPYGPDIASFSIRISFNAGFKFDLKIPITIS